MDTSNGVNFWGHRIHCPANRVRGRVFGSRKVGVTVTQETEEILEMTEIPEEVMQEEGVEIEQPV